MHDGDQFTAVAILGGPGSGKGTIARRLEAEHGLVHIDMGGLLRRRARVDDELGRSIAETQARGLMVPKDVVVAVLNDALAGLDRSQGLVLDGFPRTAAQVAVADDGRVPVSVRLAIWLDVPRDIAQSRLRRRASIEPRDDDDDEVADQRFDLMADTVDAVRAEYQRRGILEVVDASGSADHVYDAVVACLAPLWSLA